MKRTLTALAATAALAAAVPVRAEESCHDAKTAGAAADAGAAAAAQPAGGAGISFPDEVLVDRHGNPVRLLGDVVRDRIVVMDFVFTTCTTICPLLSGIMKGVEDGLPEDARGEVALVTLSVDPARDTPARLAAYAARWKAGPGWTFLTGEQGAVRRVLEAAGAYTADFTAHPPMVLVGDGRTGAWVRLNGFPKRAQVLAEIAALRAKRGALAGSTPKGG